MKKYHFWLIVLVVFLISSSIVLACLFSDSYANLFTMISGWISGIATFVVGVIAYKQSKKNEFISKRFETLDKIEHQRNDFISEMSQIICQNQILDILNKLSQTLEFNIELSLHEEYNIQLSELKTTLNRSANKLHTFSYINKKCMENLMTSVNSLIKFLEENLGFDKQYSDRLPFGVHKQNAVKKSRELIENIITGKNECLNSIKDVVEQIYKIDNTEELVVFLDGLDHKKI